VSAVAALSAALALGGMAFFSFVVAPLVFSWLPADTAGTLIRATFGHYYLYVIGTAAVAALALLAVGASWAAVAAMALVAALGVYARQSLMPAINRFRDAELAGDAAAGAGFAARHRVSVAINMVQLTLVDGVVATQAWRP
jgi:hypothetical protein